MALEQVGVEAVLKDENFQQGLKRYIDGLHQSESKTASSGNAISRAWDAVASHFVITAGDIVGATKTVIGAFEDVATKGFKTTLAWGENLDKLGDMFGLNAKQADIWATTMDRFGVPIEEGAQQLNFFTRGLADMIKVGKDGVATLTPFGEALKKLGINGIDSVTKKTKTFNQVMPEVLKAFSKLPAGVDASNLAMDLFGARGGSKMLDFLRDGSKSIPEITKRIEELGGMTDDQVGNVEGFGRVWKDLEDIMRRFWLQIGNALLPIIQDLTEYINKNVLPVFAKWAKDNAPKITEALRALGDWIRSNLMTTLSKLATWFISQGIPLFIKFSSFVVTTIIPAINKMARAWSDFWKAADPILKKFAAWLSNDGVKSLQKFFDKMDEFAPLQKRWLDLLEKMGNTASKVFSGIVGDATVEFPKLEDIVSSTMDRIAKSSENKLNLIENLWKAAESIIRLDWQGFYNALVQINEGMMNLLLNAIGIDLSDFQQLFRNAWQAVLNINWAGIGSAIVSAIQSGLAAAGGIYNAIISPFQNAINWIMGIQWGNLGTWLMTSLSNAIGNLFGSIYNNFISPLQSAITWIQGIDWWSIGGWIFQNIANGLNNLAWRVSQALQGPLQQLLNTINAILQSMGIAVGMAPSLDSAMAGASRSFSGAGAVSSFSQSSSVVQNFNLTVNSSSPSSRVSSDFGIMRALSGI